MKYRVHYPYYCTARNVNVPAGVYDEKDIDLTIGRRLSMISPANLDVESPKVETKIDQVRDVVMNADPYGVSEVNLNPEVQHVKLKKLKINSAPEAEIAAIKYVSKKNASDAVVERDDKKFTSYEDLNARVPLAFKRKWEDLTLVDFELLTELTNKDLVTKYD